MANIRSSRRSGLVLRGGRNRRESLWADHTPVSVNLTAVGGTIFTSGNAALLALRPFTIVRTRVTLFVRSDQEAASEFQVGAYGHAVVSDQAEAIGVTAVPTPITDMASDLWFVHQMVMSEYVLGEGSRSRPWLIDSKAMRQVEEGEQLITVGEFASGAAGNGLIIAAGGRFLIKLH